MQVLSGVAFGGRELQIGFEDVSTVTGDSDFAAVPGLTVENWADESLRVAKVAYRTSEGSPSIMAGGAILGDSYLKVAEPLLVEQMARAGVRLADELNAIFR